MRSHLWQKPCARPCPDGKRRRGGGSTLGSHRPSPRRGDCRRISGALLARPRGPSDDARKGGSIRRPLTPLLEARKRRATNWWRRCSGINPPRRPPPRGLLSEPRSSSATPRPLARGSCRRSPRPPPHSLAVVLRLAGRLPGGRELVDVACGGKRSDNFSLGCCGAHCLVISPLPRIVGSAVTRKLSRLPSSEMTKVRLSVMPSSSLSLIVPRPSLLTE